MKKHTFLRRSLLAFYLIMATLVSGCGSASHSDPSRYNLHFQAHPQINGSAPLKVRVMLLKSDAEFMSSDFYSLQNQAQKVLGSNLINSDEFFLMPGQLAKNLSGPSSPDARYIGVMAKSGVFRCRCPMPETRRSGSSGSSPRMSCRPTSFLTSTGSAS